VIISSGGKNLLVEFAVIILTLSMSTCVGEKLAAGASSDANLEWRFFSLASYGLHFLCVVRDGGYARLFCF
jgi:hypothetical protein